MQGCSRGTWVKNQVLKIGINMGLLSLKLVQQFKVNYGYLHGINPNRTWTHNDHTWQHKHESCFENILDFKKTSSYCTEKEFERLGFLVIFGAACRHGGENWLFMLFFAYQTPFLVSVQKTCCVMLPKQRSL